MEEVLVILINYSSLLPRLLFTGYKKDSIVRKAIAFSMISKSIYDAVTSQNYWDEVYKCDWTLCFEFTQKKLEKSFSAFLLVNYIGHTYHYRMKNTTNSYVVSAKTGIAYIGYTSMGKLIVDTVMPIYKKNRTKNKEIIHDDILLDSYKLFEPVSFYFNIPREIELMNIFEKLIRKYPHWHSPYTKRIESINENIRRSYAITLLTKVIEFLTYIWFHAEWFHAGENYILRWPVQIICEDLFIHDKKGRRTILEICKELQSAAYTENFLALLEMRIDAIWQSFLIND